jgi:hypothetical protein
VPVAAVVSLFTIILAPVALLALGLWLFGLFAGAVPVLAALGRRVTRDRYSLMGGFVIAAVGWRLLRIIPLAGFFIFGLVVIWGLGAWAITLWEAWRASGEADEVAPEVEAAFIEPGPRMELLGLDVPASAGADEPPAANRQPPASEGPPVPGPRPPAEEPPASGPQPPAKEPPASGPRPPAGEDDA